MWISPAFAQDAAAAPAGGGILQTLLMFGLIIVIFYFLLIRPQQKRMKEHRAMIDAIQRGDTVVTSGGLIGKVVRVHDDELQVELAEGTRVRVVRSTVAELRNKPQPADSGDKDDTDTKNKD